MARQRIAEGDVALAGREAEIALAEYGHALSLAEDAEPRLVAEIFTRLGHAHRMLGQREARDCYERARRIDRRHATALRCLVEMAAADEDWSEVAELEEHLFAVIDDPDHLCLELIASGDRWLSEADAPLHARVRYFRALHANPDSRSAERRLLAVRAARSSAS